MTEEDIMSVSLCNDRDRTCSVKREMPTVLFMYVFVNDSQTTSKESHSIMCSKPHVKSWDGSFWFHRLDTGHWGVSSVTSSGGSRVSQAGCPNLKEGCQPLPPSSGRISAIDR